MTYFLARTYRQIDPCAAIFYDIVLLPLTFLFELNLKNHSRVEMLVK